MFRSADLLAPMRGGDGFGRRGNKVDSAVEDAETAAVRMWRYLPLAMLATGSVVVLPGALVAAVVPWGGALWALACAALAMALAIVLASAEATLWARQPWSRDLVFADLMLWGWLRRCWTERRLAQARELYDSASKAGPTVSIELLQRLSRLLEARDAYTHGHSRRVARHAGRIARAMRLSPTEIAKIRTAATVHDVGKLYTPREILNNPGLLTDREFAIVKLHPGDGADMLAEVGDPEIAAMVRHHHERIDGGGYPDGLAGSEIPLGARIIAVADTFDAITSSRAYRPAGTHKKALDILSREAGSQLDGAAVAAFLHRYSARRSLALLSFAVAIPERIFAGLQAASSSLGVGAAGTTSILPALGAAGLLAFSPGLRHGTSVDRGAHRPASHAPTGRPFRRPQPPPRRGTPGGQGAFVRPHRSIAEAAEPCPPLPARRRPSGEPRANRTPPRAAHARVRAKLPPARRRKAHRRPRQAHRRPHHRPPRPPRKLRSRPPKLQRSRTAGQPAGATPERPRPSPAIPARRQIGGAAKPVRTASRTERPGRRANPDPGSQGKGSYIEQMAERGGFEPPNEVNPRYAISSRAHSTALAPLHGLRCASGS